MSVSDRLNMEFACMIIVADSGGAAKAPDSFKRLWDLGFRRLVPILPPDAQVSPRSSYSRNLGARGKAVGVKDADGFWFGFDWVTCEATETDLRKWTAMGAGVGIKTGPCDPARPDAEWIIGIDSDVLDVDLAREVDKIVHKHFGALPCRIGKQPKALYPIRVSGPIRYMRVGFGGNDATTGRPKHAVEILGAMKQFVAPNSIHPGTGQPYYWARPIVPLNALPITTPEKLKAFMDDLRASLPGATDVAAGSAPTDRSEIDQDGLRGDPDMVERAVRAIPNTVEHFPTYDDMTRIGIAIHGALPDDPDRGLEIFTEWAASWDGFGKDDCFDPSYIKTKWESYKPPHSLGASFLYDKAAKLAPDKFKLEELWFSEIPDEPGDAKKEAPGSLFDVGSAERGRSWQEFEAASIVTLADLSNIPPPQFVLGTRFQPGVVTLGVGSPGVSKTTFAILSGLAIATARPLTGEHVFQSGPVLIFSNEDNRAMMLRRMLGVAKFHRLDVDSLVGRVHVLSGQDVPPIVFAHRSDSRGAITRSADVAGLAEFVRHKGIVHVVFDPMVTLHRGLDENASGDMERLGVFLRDFARETGVSVDLIHHPVKSVGQDRERNAGRADAGRGSGAIIGYVRSAYTLSPMGSKTATELGLSSDQAASLMRLDDAKQNYARRSGRERWFRLQSLQPDNGELVPPSRFESADKNVVARALESVGVHERFDIGRMRSLVRLTKSDDAEREQEALRDYIAILMAGPEIERSTVCQALMDEHAISDTAARRKIDDAIPKQRAKGAPAVADGIEYRLWREERRGRPIKWIIYREETGRVVCQNAYENEEEDAHPGLFA